MENRGVVERRTEDSMIVFLGCVFAELVLYALAVLLASGDTPPWCQGADLCGSDRDMLLFAGLVFGLAFLVGQLVVGVTATALISRLDIHHVASGLAGLVIATICSGLAVYGLHYSR
jgi:hypothetical protein